MNNPTETRGQHVDRQPPALKQNTQNAKSEQMPGNCKCRQAPEGTGPGRKLVVAIDGTSNQFGDKNTNVVELYARISKTANQLTYYNSGIGTYVKPNRLFSSWRSKATSLSEMAFAWNFNSTVLAAYLWLSENYRDGDRIFLFGFSRGAYQVRVLAGMIETVGLIFAGNHEQIPYAYELYKDSVQVDEQANDKPPKGSDQLEKDAVQPKAAANGGGPISRQTTKETTKPSESKPKPTAGGPQGKADVPNTSKAQNENDKIDFDKAARFKSAFSRPDVKIHFMGVWDTVSSVGFLREKDLPCTQSCEHICYFRHALALDECRVKFIPEGINTPHAQKIQKSLRESRKGDRNLTKNADQNTGKVEQTTGPKNGAGGEHKLTANLPVKPSETRDDGRGRPGASNKEREGMKEKVLQPIKEVWFAGSHSDVGGGSKINRTLNLDDVPALWMANEAQTVGLDLQASKVEWNWDALKNDAPTASLKWYWKILEYLFIPRLKRRGIDITWVPNRGRGRVIHPGQKIHASVAFKEGYIPKATFSDHWQGRKPDWKDIIGMGEKDSTEWARNLGDILELDLFDLSNVESLVTQLKEKNKPKLDVLQRLSFIALVDGGAEAIVNTKDALSSLFNILKAPDVNLQLESVSILLRITRHVYTGSSFWQNDIVPALLEILKTTDNIDLQSKAVAIMIDVDDLQDAMTHCSEKLPAAIIHLLSLSEPETQLDFLNAIELVAENENIRQAVFKSDALKSFKKFLESDDSDVLQYTAQALGSLAHYPDVQAKISVSEVVAFTGKLLRKPTSYEPDMQVEGIHLLSRLFKYSDFRAKIAHSDAIRSLIKLALDEDFPRQRAVRKGLSKIVRYDASSVLVAILASEAFGLISEPLEESINNKYDDYDEDDDDDDDEDDDEDDDDDGSDDDEEHKEGGEDDDKDDSDEEDYEEDEDDEYDGIQSAFDVLSALAKNDTTRNAVIESNVMDVLKRLLLSERPSLLKHATKGLIDLATKHDDIRAALFTPEVIRSVQQTGGGDGLLTRLHLGPFAR